MMKMSLDDLLGKLSNYDFTYQLTVAPNDMGAYLLIETETIDDAEAIHKIARAHIATVSGWWAESRREVCKIIVEYQAD